MNIKKNSPIFIHSLFRSGSTYFVEAFRRSSSNYWCYQEPLHEIFLSEDLSKEFLLKEDNEKASYLRHPALSKPYFYEFTFIIDDIKRLFKKSFPYDLYFLSKFDDAAELKSYLGLLLERAPATPIFQCCRSIGRIEGLKKEFDGIHIFLWRNPWDQWWSYKTDFFFDRANLLIANSLTAPEFIKKLRSDINLPEFHSDNLYDEILFAKARRLSSENSYMLFYSLWCHAFINGMSFCDLDINIDMLSASLEYRDNIKQKLNELGVLDLDFSDCDAPIHTYSEDDRAFFEPIEERIHGLFQYAGVPSKQIEKMLAMRKSHAVSLSGEKLSRSLMKTASRHAKLIRRYETELSKMTSQWSVAVEAARLAESEALEARECKDAAEARAEQSEIRLLEALLKAGEAEKNALLAFYVAFMAIEREKAADKRAEKAKEKANLAESRARDAELRLAAITNSISWRITAPLRSAPANFVYRQIISVKEQGLIGRVKFVGGNLFRIGAAKAIHFIERHPRLRKETLRFINWLGLYERAKAFYEKIAHENKKEPPSFMPSPFADEGLDDLSPRAQDIFFKLKKAIKTHRKQKENRGL